MWRGTWPTRVRQQATSTSTRCSLAGSSTPTRSNPSQRRSVVPVHNHLTQRELMIHVHVHVHVYVGLRVHIIIHVYV